MAKKKNPINLDIPSQDIRKNHYQELVDHMPLKDKVYWAKQKIEEFLKYCEKQKENEVLVSFSGGKDSTVLFDLVFDVHQKIQSKVYLVPAYAIEITFPSTIKFIKEITAYYQQKSAFIKDPYFVKPKKAWIDILHTKGFPIYSKQISVMLNRLKNSKTKNTLTKIAFGIEPSARYKLSYHRLFLLDWNMTHYFNEKNERVDYFFSEKCCDYVKGGLKHEKRPSFVGTMANESLLRKQSWIRNGCNIYDKSHPMSRPLSIWNSNDVWDYIKNKKLKINDAYGYDEKTHNIDKLRFSRLGCTSCPLGTSIEEIVANKFSKDDKLATEYKHRNRFEKLYEYAPSLYQSQVWKTEMYRIIADMKVKIRNDGKYMEFYYKRQKEIEEWYKDIKTNLLKVMIQIEMSDNNSGWSYDIQDFNKALKHYNIDHQTNAKEIKELRKIVKNEKHEIKKQQKK